MASSSIFRFIIGFILLVNLTLGIGGEIVFEEGYTVTTLIDGDKLNINPYSVFSLYGSSSDLIILDHVKSTIYTVSFSDSQGVDIKKLSGNGDAGYMDGDLGSAMFNKPKSFALDRKNNIYIADMTNHVIRKISKSGVTTIAGGYVRKTGKADGPAQNASFSDDFELAFDPQRCTLLISDHGNRLVRQLDLKAEDCAGSSSGSGLGSTTAWGIGMGVACLIGLIIGFAIRPYVLPHEASGHPRFNTTWKHYLIHLGKQARTSFFVNRSAIASNNLYKLLNKLLRLSFSQLSLVFGLNMIRPPTPPPPVKFVSLLDCDHVGKNETIETQDLVDELKDLITLDGSLNPKPVLSYQENPYRVEETKNDEFLETRGKLDRQIHANFAGFVESSKRTSSVESRGLVL
ncbi:uncharacterized protein LOC112523595 isoform X1 [Cynara cardunculus var. scolymus]|uniref:uncharacterized protein LOC112523595 isoform X1 n=1 Tax=Cynara cardunculus var. scolymus TaxID=59895 RepID=UPI000D62338F|nr:uncharacterized protein LOC112523595 isoform X1 [Cynara cardunculus var. scolymus]